ncbi:MAG TPA: DNA repair protein RecO, partial [Caldimonas sp.]|nr:DNA repair protein RecO [Caldimonas sp.]
MASRSSRSPALVAFVLHRYDWSESSLILDLFTRERGRLAAAAKGARRPFSQLRSVLLPFQRIQVSVGSLPADENARDIENLRSAEWMGGGAMLTGAALFNGFYLNELLMRLLARHDPHPALFDAYSATIASLGTDDAGSQAALRGFEMVLLKEIGVLPDLAIETSTGRPVAAEERYRVLADSGVVAAAGATDS